MEQAHEGHGKQTHYARLLVMTVVSFIAMYILMYAMVDRFANVYPSFNQFYMAGLMVLDSAQLRGFDASAFPLLQEVVRDGDPAAVIDAVHDVLQDAGVPAPAQAVVPQHG